MPSEGLVSFCGSLALRLAPGHVADAWALLTTGLFRRAPVEAVNTAASFVSDPEKYAWAGRDGMTVRKAAGLVGVTCTMELGDRDMGPSKSQDY
jgi:hypothetical protein